MEFGQDLCAGPPGRASCSGTAPAWDPNPPTGAKVVHGGKWGLKQETDTMEASQCSSQTGFTGN